MHGTGRFPECFNFEEAYTDSNLVEGIAYCEGLLEDGFRREPFFKFDLRKFIRWARKCLSTSITNS